MLSYEQRKIGQLFKVPFFKYFLAVLMSIVSVYIWVNSFEFNFLKIFGLVINIAGLIVWWAGKLTLAQNWNSGFVKPAITKLVTRGVYSKIRHPMYWGINLTFVGLVFMFPKVWFVVLSILVIIYFLFRMRQENMYLRDSLGGEYRNYERNTWI